MTSRPPVLVALVLAVMTVSIRGQGAPAKPDRSADLDIQVMLDRARYSPGEIDGMAGLNTRRAAAAFAKSRGPSGTTDTAEFRQALGTARRRPP